MNDFQRGRGLALAKWCSKGRIPHELRIRDGDGACLCRNCGKHLGENDEVLERPGLSPEAKAERRWLMEKERRRLADLLRTDGVRVLSYLLDVLDGDPSPFTRHAVDLARDYEAEAYGTGYNLSDWEREGGQLGSEVLQ
jgi:hypothetical protein